MRFHRPKRVQRRHRFVPKHDTKTHSFDALACEEFLHRIWDLDWHSDFKHQTSDIPPEAYLKHWGNARHELSGRQRGICTKLALDHREVVYKLLDMVKSRYDRAPDDVVTDIMGNYPWAGNPTQAVSMIDGARALQFAIKLWLGVTLPEEWVKSSAIPGPTIREAVADLLPKPSQPPFDLEILSDDFCEKHLCRKGGFTVRYTDELSEHLRLIPSEKVILVFPRASLLRQFNLMTDCPYPTGLVEETLRTLYVLYRPWRPHNYARNSRHMNRNLHADLEMALVTDVDLKLEKFPYWRPRLIEIQKAYDKARPSGIAHWWYDRRDVVQFATFWIAFVVFVLTVVFGIISTVTSIMQVVAAY